MRALGAGTGEGKRQKAKLQRPRPPVWKKLMLKEVKDGMNNKETKKTKVGHERRLRGNPESEIRSKLKWRNSVKRES